MKKQKKVQRAEKSALDNIVIKPGIVTWNVIKESGWLPAIILLSVLVILFSLRLINNLDIGFNLKGGEWVLKNFAFHSNDVFTYTVNNNEYINLHWLYQVLFYVTYVIFSYTGLSILNSIIIILLFYLIFKRFIIIGIPLQLTVFLIFILLLVIQIRFSFRPELITWLGIVLMLLILDNYFFFGRKELKFIPFIIILWVNMHGLFIISIFILTAYFVSIYLKEKKIDKYYLKWYLLSVAALLVNPYFIKGTLFPIYLATRLEPSNIFKQTITELKPPWEFVANFPVEIYLFVALGIIAFILLLLSYKKRYFHEFVILAGFGFIAYQSFRNMPIFLIYAVTIIGVSLSGLYKEHKEKFGKLIQILSGKFAVYFLSIVMFLISIRIVTNAYYISYGTGIDFGAGLNENSFPVNAADFMNRNKLDGKIINYFSFGSWFIWQLPQPVFIDGRLEVIQENFYSEYMNSFSNGGLKKLIDKYDPVIVAYEHYPGYQWTQQLNGMQDWRLIYWDEIAAVYIRENYMSNIPVSGFQENEIKGKYNISYSSDLNELIGIGKLYDFNFWLKGFYGKSENRQDLLKIALFALDNNQPRIAKDCYLGYLQISEGYLLKENYKDLYSNLGNIFYNEKDYTKAKICYRKYLEVDPGNSEVVKILNSIR